jgi:hypothetical protein
MERRGSDGTNYCGTLMDAQSPFTALSTYVRWVDKEVARAIFSKHVHVVELCSSVAEEGGAARRIPVTIMQTNIKTPVIYTFSTGDPHLHRPELLV